MAGFKTFVDDVPLFATELNGYLMRQTVMRFGTTTAMLNALPVGVRELGMLAWADNVGILYMFDGSNWVPWFSPEKTSFSPLFTAGGVNVTIGNGTVNSLWRYSGGMVKWNFRFVMGSTSNTQSGAYALSLPIATKAELDFHVLGQASFYDLSATTMFHRGAATFGTTSSIGIVAEAGQRMGSAAPVVGGTGDVLGISLVYPPSTGTYL